jgi:hypothetical protein
MLTMYPSAVATLDLLGFGGIWSRAPVQEVLETLSAIHAYGENYVSEKNEVATRFGRLFSVSQMGFTSPTREEDISGRNTELTIHKFSDNIFLVATDRVYKTDNPKHAEMHELGLLREIVNGVVLIGLAATMHNQKFCFRGAISTGLIAVGKDIVAGPAVDDAASVMNKTNGAFTVLTPKTMNLFRDIEPEGKMNRPDLIYHDVPMRDGRIWNTMVVNPVCLVDNAEAQVQRMMSTFHSNLVDVAVKRQNTELFLRECLHRNEMIKSKLSGV